MRPARLAVGFGLGVQPYARLSATHPKRGVAARCFMSPALMIGSLRSKLCSFEFWPCFVNRQAGYLPCFLGKENTISPLPVLAVVVPKAPETPVTAALSADGRRAQKKQTFPRSENGWKASAKPDPRARERSSAWSAQGCGHGRRIDRYPQQLPAQIRFRKQRACPRSG